MNKIKLLLLIPSLLFAQVTSLSGEGTEENPYIIKTDHELAFMAERINAEDEAYNISSTGGDVALRYYRLESDIDLSANYGKTFNGGKGWITIGSRVYAGSPYVNLHFDGNGHVIRGLYINVDNNFVGLFGFLNSGSVTNLGLEDVDITNSSAVRVGGIAGRTTLNFIISNCYTTGKIIGNIVGGIVGFNVATIVNSYSTATVSGKGSAAGGIAGQNYGTILNSYSTGTVNYTGVSDYYDYVGGIAGQNGGGTIVNSYFTGTVSGSNYVGGIAGINNNSYIGTISNSYSMATVNGKTYVGGLVGSGGNISNSYSASVVNGEENVGGLVGSSTVPANNYWNTEISGINGCGSYSESYTCDGEGRTTSAMKLRVSYTNSLDIPSLDPDDGWDFVDTWAISSDINDGYPYLIANPPPNSNGNSGSGGGGFIMPPPFAGSGTEADPYIISSEWQLAYIVLRLDACDETYLSAYFKLGNNISLGIYGAINSAFSLQLYENWLQRCPFEGVLDGNDKEISGFIGDLEDLLSGYIENGNVINLEIENLSLSSSSTAETPSSSSENTETPSSSSAETPSSSSVAETPSSSSGTQTPSSSSENAETPSSSGGTPSSSSGTQTPIRTPQIAKGPISVQPISEGIMLANLPSDTKIELYNLQGKQVYLGNSENSQILKILIQTKGVYIVKAGAERFSVVVK